MRGAVVTDVLESKPHASSSAQTIVLLANWRTRTHAIEKGQPEKRRGTRRRRRDVYTHNHTYATTPSPALSCDSAKRNSDRYASDHSAPKYDVKSPCAGSRSALNAS